MTIEHQYEQLHESGTLDNFRRVAAGESGKFSGMWFQDSDAYKWLEAASYVLATEDDPNLEEKVDEVILLVTGAQWDDGYVNTYFSLLEPNNRWTNLHMMHELYCAGHLIEAAVAHHRATGKTSLLDVARDFADHIDDLFDEVIDGVPGHEEIELALIQLFRVTDTERYLHLAKYFIDLRGKDDRLAWELANLDEIGGHEYDDGALFSNEGGRRSLFLDTEGEYDGSYAQAHEPLLKQETVEGHSVRAMYLFAAAADLAMEIDEPALVDTLERLWRNMTTKRMYISGGIGPEERHEGFTIDYDLRNDAYAETCAAVGSVFWNQRLFELSGESKYSDLIERILYNGFLAGVSENGRKFFYENPLESDGDHHRKGWFTCACCPPNVARLLASLGGYLYARDESSLYVNQYIGSTVSTRVGDVDVEISQESSLPWEGDIQIQIDGSEPAKFSVFLRIPEWCDDITVEINGEVVETEHDSYFELTRTWEEDEITLSLSQRVERTVTHPAVEANAGRIALQRGPLVYCTEAVDNDRQLHQYELPETGSIEVMHRADFLDGISILECEARVPNLGSWDDQLYAGFEQTDVGSDSLIAIPYYAWDNREPGAMQVWIRSDAGQWS